MYHTQSGTANTEFSLTLTTVPALTLHFHVCPANRFYTRIVSDYVATMCCMARALTLQHSLASYSCECTLHCLFNVYQLYHRIKVCAFNILLPYSCSNTAHAETQHMQQPFELEIMAYTRGRCTWVQHMLHWLMLERTSTPCPKLGHSLDKCYLRHCNTKYLCTHWHVEV